MMKSVNIILLIAILLSSVCGFSEDNHFDYATSTQSVGGITIIYPNDIRETSKDETDDDFSNEEAFLLEFFGSIGIEYDPEYDKSWCVEIQDNSMYEFSQYTLNEQIKAICENEETVNAIIRGLYLIDYFSFCKCNGNVLSIEFLTDTLNNGGFSYSINWTSEDVLYIALSPTVGLSIELGGDESIDIIRLEIIELIDCNGEIASVAFRMDDAARNCIYSCMQSTIDEKYNQIQDKAQITSDIITAVYLIDYCQNIDFFSFKIETADDFELILLVGDFAYNKKEISNNEIAYFLSNNMYIGLTLDDEKHISNVSFTLESLTDDEMNALSSYFREEDLFHLRTNPFMN